MLPGILTDTGRPCNSGTRALPSDPMPSPGVTGTSAVRQVCNPEIRFTDVRPAQVCSAHVCSQSVRVAQIRLAAPQQLRLNQAYRQGADRVTGSAMSNT